MPVPTYTVRCTENTLIARDVYQVRFAKPEGFMFKPGQFILFDVPHPDNKEDIQARAYSIASTPDEPDLLFAIKLTPGGRMSRWLVEKITPGKSSFVMKGPFGTFVVDPNPDRELLFLCTSTGNGPFRSQIKAALEAGDRRPMDLIYGVRSEEDLFWEQEFTQLANQYDTLSLHFCLSQGSDAWTGHRGRVQTLIPQVVRDFSRKSLYACGSPVMTKEIKELALTQWGMTKKDVHVEGYI